MSWSEFVVVPAYTPHVLAGGRSIGRLKLLWSQINRIGDYWRPHNLSRVVFSWRGITLGVGTYKGLKFVELTLAYRRVALAWFDKDALYRARSSFSVMDRLQNYYDKAIKRGFEIEESPAAFGLRQVLPPVHPLGDGPDNGLLPSDGRLSGSEDTQSEDIQ